MSHLRTYTRLLLLVGATSQTVACPRWEEDVITDRRDAGVVDGGQLNGDTRTAADVATGGDTQPADALMPGPDATMPGPDTSPSMAVWPPEATSFKASQGLGFGPRPSDACMSPNSYEFTRTTRRLAWDYCATRIDAQRTTGSRVLTTSESARLEASLSALSPPASTSCGADKGLLQLTVETPQQSKTYVDSFYQCQRQPGVTYVDKIDAVFTELRALGKPATSP